MSWIDSPQLTPDLNSLIREALIRRGNKKQIGIVDLLDTQSERVSQEAIFKTGRKQKFSFNVRDVISFSREEATRLGHGHVATEHLLLGIIREGEGMAVEILRNLGCELSQLKQVTEGAVRKTPDTPTVDDPMFTKHAERVLKITYLEAKLYKSDVIGTEHLLLSLLRDHEGSIAKILQEGFLVSYDSVRQKLDAVLRQAG